MNVLVSKMYEHVPDWVKNLQAGDTLMIYFPNKMQVSYSEVVSNFIPDTTEHLAILTVRYKLNNIKTIDDLLYENYSGSEDAEETWSAYQII